MSKYIRPEQRVLALLFALIFLPIYVVFVLAGRYK